MRWKNLGPRNLETYLTLEPGELVLDGLNQHVCQQLTFNEELTINANRFLSISDTLIFVDEAESSRPISQTLVFTDQADGQAIYRISQTINFINTVVVVAIFNRTIVQMLDFTEQSVGVNVKSVSQTLTFVDVATGIIDNDNFIFIPIMRKKIRYSTQYRYGYYRCGQSYPRAFAAEAYDIRRETVVINMEEL